MQVSVKISLCKSKYQNCGFWLQWIQDANSKLKIYTALPPVSLHSEIPQQEETARLDHTVESEKILCPHCLRTATNGIKCKGICVADSDY
jgi:hypothetical protein